MSLTIQSAVIEKSEPLNNNNMKHLQKELNILEVTGEKTNNISFLIDALKTVPPIYIESERAFSAAGIFITKLWTRLNDCNINHLSFLKSH